MQADTPEVERDIQRALANASSMQLWINCYADTPLTVNDARRIIACLRENLRFDTLFVWYYSLHTPAVLNVFRNGLLSCPSVTTVSFDHSNLGNEDLDRLRPAFYNNSVRKLDITDNNIQGQRGGEVLRDLLVGNNTLLELILFRNPIGPEGAIRLGEGMTDNNRLQKLYLSCCNIGNDGLANLLPADGMNNNCLTHLYLNGNGIQGAEGGRQVSLLLQRFPSLTLLKLSYNNLGPLGARALAPGLAAASCLELLELDNCELANDGVASLIPDGEVNSSLTNLNLSYNDILGLEGGENLIELASCCTNLDSLDMVRNTPILNPDQQRRLNLLLDRKRLCAQSSALAGSTFSVLFRAVEEFHSHEHGLSAIFLILQNDGDDYFGNANNRAIE